MGGARTALFNFLFARAEGGRFLLRIEDTDQARSSDEMTGQIIAALDWLSLEVDELPVHQADGLERHRAAADRLVAAGAVYPSFLGEEELVAVRTAAREAGVPVRRDRLGEGDPAVARERMAAGDPHALFFAVPEGGRTTWEDVVHGPSGIDNASLDDFVVLRSDGTPVYNLAVVTDDLDMGITHVIRGDDHLSNTPKQVLIYEALGAQLPLFCHVPMILGADGKRLSKRHGAASVEAFREQGILPEALVNYLALLGWSPGDDREVMSLEEMIEVFSLDRILKKASVFDGEKLEWLNGRYLDALGGERLAPLLLAQLPEPERSAAAAEPDRLAAVADLVRQRTRTVAAMAEQARPFFTPIESFGFEEAAVGKHWRETGLVAERVRAVRELLAAADAFDQESLESDLRGLADRLGVRAGQLFQPLRVALVGTDHSPGIFDVIVLLGRERAVSRLDRALAELAVRRDSADA